MAQEAHETDPLSRVDLPTGHCWQLLDPVVFEKVPWEHGVQTSLPILDLNVPAAQGTQVPLVLV